MNRSLTCLYPKTGVDRGMFRVAHVVAFKYSKNLKIKFTAFPQHTFRNNFTCSTF